MTTTMTTLIALPLAHARGVITFLRAGDEANVILAQWLTVTTTLVCCIELRTAVPTSSQLTSLRVASDSWGY